MKSLPLIPIMWIGAALLNIPLWVPAIGTVGLIAYVEVQRRTPKG